MTDVIKACFNGILISCLISPRVGFAESRPQTNLNAGQVFDLKRAAAEGHDLKVKVLTTLLDGRPRTVVILGEHHLAKANDLVLGRDMIDGYEYIAVENGIAQDGTNWSYLMLPVMATASVPGILATLVFEGRELESPMGLAKHGRRLKRLTNAEQLHRPRWREEIDLLLMGFTSLASVLVSANLVGTMVGLTFGARTTPPFERMVRAALAWGAFAGLTTVYSKNLHHFPIVKNRDRSMAKYIDGWARIKENDGPLLVIVGYAHLRNLGKFLSENYGFTDVPLAEVEPAADCEPLLAGAA